jgi:hypothetical protein
MRGYVLDFSYNKYNYCAFLNTAMDFQVPYKVKNVLTLLSLAPYSKNNHCCVHECPPLKATMNQFKEVHTLIPCSFQIHFNAKTERTLRHESASELYRPSDRHLSAKLVPTIADRRVSRSQRGWFPTAVSRSSRPETLLFLSSSSSIVLTRLSGPRSRSTTCQKIW